MTPTIKIDDVPSHATLYKLAHSLAVRVAHQPADIDDLVQEAVWSAHRRLNKKPEPRKPLSLARTVMLRSMYTYYKGGWRLSGAKHREDYPLSWAPPSKATHDPCLAWDSKVDLDAFLTALEEYAFKLARDTPIDKSARKNLRRARQRGALARRITENMLSPRDPVYCQYLDGVALERKTKRVLPSYKKLRIVSKLSRTEWRQTLRIVRHFTANYLITAYGPNALPTRLLRYVEK